MICSIDFCWVNFLFNCFVQLFMYNFDLVNWHGRKHRAGSPAVPFAREFTTTPVNRQSHARQGVPRIWAVARQAGQTYLSLNNIVIKLCMCHLSSLCQRISSTRRVLAGKYTVAACFVAPSVLWQGGKWDQYGGLY